MCPVARKGVAVFALLLLGLSHAPSQEIPKGVRYKRAKDDVNRKAEGVLRKLLNIEVEDKVILASTEKVLVCGPGLWAAAKKAAPDSLKTALKVTFIVPNADGVQNLEGRAARKPEQIIDLWTCVLALHQRSKPPTIRKAKASELKYCWAIVPYDIEEPFFIADYGKTQLLFDFAVEGGVPKVAFVDIVGKWGAK